MALELNIGYARAVDKLSITVTDLTGSGATGYGGSNPSVGDFTNFNISVTVPDPVTLLPTGTAIIINAYPSLPSALDGTFSITTEMLGNAAGTELIDGVYLFTVAADYTGGSEGTATTSDYKAFYEIVACCITRMTTAAIGCGCAPDSEKIQRLVLANMWLTQLQPYTDENGVVSASPIETCGQWNKAADLIRDLQRICLTENCKGCGGC